MSFAGREDVLLLMENLLQNIWPQVLDLFWSIDLVPRFLFLFCKRADSGQKK